MRLMHTKMGRGGGDPSAYDLLKPLATPLATPLTALMRAIWTCSTGLQSPFFAALSVPQALLMLTSRV